VELPKPAEATLHALHVELDRALGDELVGIYLTGSAVISHVDPASSDLDLFVVTRRRLTEPQIGRLDALHRRLAREVPWGDRLDVEYGGLDQLRPTGIEGETVFVVPGGELERGTSVSAADDVFGVREYGLPLVGPPPREVFPAVSRETYVESRRDYLRDLLRRGEQRPDASDREFALWSLEIARCLFGLESGALCSKPQAAEWLAGREPSLREALDDARAGARSGYAALAAYAETVLTPPPPGGGESEQRRAS
jgi:Aminoglycoside adenylyltransferase, C-terminal domain